MLWWNLNKIVWSKLQRNFQLFDKKQAFYKHFRQRVHAILDDVSVHVAEIIVQCLTISLKTTIFQCSKNYVSVTRLKVAPNIADPISLEDSDSSLNRGNNSIHVRLLLILMLFVV